MHKRSVQSNVNEEKKTARQNVNWILDQSECDQSQKMKKKEQKRKKTTAKWTCLRARQPITTVGTRKAIVQPVLGKRTAQRTWYSMQANRFRCDLKQKIENRLLQKKNNKKRTHSLRPLRLHSFAFCSAFNCSTQGTALKRDTLQEYRNMFIDDDIDSVSRNDWMRWANGIVRWREQPALASYAVQSAFNVADRVLFRQCSSQFVDRFWMIKIKRHQFICWMNCGYDLCDKQKTELKNNKQRKNENKCITMFAYSRIVRASNRIINNFRSHHGACGAINGRRSESQIFYSRNENKC